MTNLNSNIPKLYIIKGLRWFMVIVPIIVPFFKANHLGMQQIMLLQSLFSLSLVILQIPTGYFADVLGRKFSIIIGLTCSLFGLIAYSISYSFLGFLLAELTLGIGASFISGADSAMLYDTLLDLKRENEYKKVEGRNQAIGNFSEGAASILGGIVAVISMRYPFYIQAALVFPAVILACTLKEPNLHKTTKLKPTFSDLYFVLKHALHDNKQMKWLLIYSSVVGASTMTMVWFTQPYFESVGLPLSMFGVVWAIFQFSVGGFSLFAHSLERFFGRKIVLYSLVFMAATGYLLVGIITVPWGIATILIFYFVRGLNAPLLSDYVNQLTDPSIRATILSLNGLLFRLIFAIMGPIFGYISDRYSLHVALLSCSVFFLILGSYTLLFLKKNGGLQGQIVSQAS